MGCHRWGCQWCLLLLLQWCQYDRVVCRVGEGEDHTEVNPPLLPWQPDESATLETSIDEKLDNDDDAVTFDPITDNSSPERRARIVQAKVDIVLNKV